MLSTFHKLTENDKKLLVAKILHEINYCQASFDLISLLVKYWDENTIREANYFNQNTTKLLNNEYRTN